MSQFSRRARWLNVLFPASVAPQSKDPAVFSNDVSLVQPYDGGGYGLANQDWLDFLGTVTPGVFGTEIVISTGPDELYRFLAAAVTLVAGAAPICRMIIEPTSTGGEQPVTDDVQPIGTTREVFDVLTPMIPPNTNLEIDWNSGDVNSDLFVQIMGVRVPLGTVFYV